MPRRASAKRYAQAVFQIALESDDTGKWREDLDVLAMSVRTGEFYVFLNSPQVTTSRKKELMDLTVAGSISTIALNFLSLLTERKLVHIIPDIVGEYGRLLDYHNGIEHSEIISAIPLDSDQETALAKLMTEIIQRQVRLSTTVDPKILGGFVARVGDRVIDGSVQSKLQKMHREIVDQVS